MNPTIIAFGLSILGYLSLSLMGACAKELSQIPTATVVFFQFSISWLLTLPSLYQSGWVRLKTDYPFKMLIRALSGLLSVSAMFYAVKHIPLVNAVLLQNTAPLFVPLIVRIWLQKQMDSKLWYSVVIGFFGVILILQPNSAFFSHTALIGLLAGLFSGISFVAIGILKKTEPTARILFYTFLIGSLVTFPLMLIHWQPLNVRDIILLIAVALFMYLSQVFITHAFAHARATTLAPLNYLAVAFSGILGWIIWNHVPDELSFIGIILVCCGGVISIMIEQRRKLINAVTVE